jgi:hypothetical protein
MTYSAVEPSQVVAGMFITGTLSAPVSSFQKRGAPTRGLKMILCPINPTHLAFSAATSPLPFTVTSKTKKKLYLSCLPSIQIPLSATFPNNSPTEAIILILFIAISNTSPNRTLYRTFQISSLKFWEWWQFKG